ncbi:energy coupling factor transporter S component ThiW [Bacillus sp. Marseille-P3661]|uniref:energy coupling factor transporter S component ThiW n=1 Tax=Bacillus sp. Marseille-P3661 TaxID=1936234 RepID=UPI000C8486A0|nr:energy coupling factor transporter S component ThiW [Bacillus sp. Marseille-P3661]
MRATKKLTITAMLVAIGTLTSNLFYIPIGFTKVFPMQHFINVLSAVILGPYYAVLQAFSVSLIRNMMGTGSIFAFPGSMFGALVASYFFMKTKRTIFAAIGEVFGTGILGALVAYPIATLFLGSEATLFGFIPSFIVSSIAGAIIGYITLKIVMKNEGIRRELTSTGLYK